MTTRYEQAFDAVTNWCEDHHIEVRDGNLPPEKAGEFNGVSITMNAVFRPEERLYYFVHAVGSMVLYVSGSRPSTGGSIPSRNRRLPSSAAVAEPPSTVTRPLMLNDRPI